MQAVILAAGEGRRLRPLTDDIPKALISVLGRPILEHTFEALPEEITEIVLVTGYKEERIREHFGAEFLSRPITYVSGVLPKGTGYALAEARPHIRGPFLLLNGDDLYHPKDLRSFIEKGPAVLVKQSETPERFGVCIVREGLLKGIVEKPKNPPGNLVNIGAYFLNEEIFSIPAKILPSGEWNLAEQVGELAKRRAVAAESAHFWYPINTPEELRYAEDALRKIIRRP